MTVNLLHDRLLPIKTPDLYRANQAILCTCQKYNISLGTWTSGIDKDTYDLIFSIPSNSLRFYQSEKFLKSLRNFWTQSGFLIAEEAEMVGYQIRGISAYSLVFRLQTVA